MTDAEDQRWRPCRKKPCVVHVRDAVPGEEVFTREGLTIAKDDDLVMRGIDGEVYPIGRSIFERTYDLVDEPRPTVDSGAPSGLDTSKPAPGFWVTPFEGKFDLGHDAMCGAPMFDTEELAIAESHRIYRAESAPAVAVATATLVAERDALRVRLAEVELLRDHAMQDAAAQRVLGYGLGGAITRDQLANAATYLYGPSEAARLFAAGPRADTRGTDGEEGPT